MKKERSKESGPASIIPERRQFLSASAALTAAGLSGVVGATVEAAPPNAPNMVDLSVFHTKRLGEGDVLPPDKTALIIVDMMNRFCDVQWMSHGNEERAQWVAAELAVIIPNIRKVLDAFRKAGGLIVHVVNARWTKDGRDVVKYQRGRDYDFFDTPAMSVIEELRPQRGEIIVRKVTSSAFTGTGLDFMLNNAGIENVVLSGQYGSACVFYSLIQSREFGFSNVWLEDGLLYGGGEPYKRVFQALVGTMWAKLASTPEVVRAITSSVDGTARSVR
jgi:maleamate amidohydrolase